MSLSLACSSLLVQSSSFLSLSSWSFNGWPSGFQVSGFDVQKKRRVNGLDAQKNSAWYVPRNVPPPNCNKIPRVLMSLNVTYLENSTTVKKVKKSAYPSKLMTIEELKLKALVVFKPDKTRLKHTGKLFISEDFIVRLSS